MTAPRLTLVSFPTCPFVQRAAIGLDEKGAPFEVVHIDLARKPDWFLAASPHGKVPLLKVGRAGLPDAFVFESLVILEYIEETVAGAPLHPADALERARHRAWMEFGGGLQSDLYKLFAAADAPALAAARDVVASRLQRLEDAVAGPFFAGDGFHAVDAVFAPAWHQLDLVERAAGREAFPRFDRLAGWRRALAARPSVRAAVPEDFAPRFLGRLRAAGSLLLAGAG